MNDESKLIEEQIKNGLIDFKSEESDKLLFEELKKVEGLKNYLMRSMAYQVKYYFDSPKEYKDYAKGSYFAIQNLYNKIKEDK